MAPTGNNGNNDYVVRVINNQHAPTGQGTTLVDSSGRHWTPSVGWYAPSGTGTQVCKSDGKRIFGIRFN